MIIVQALLLALLLPLIYGPIGHSNLVLGGPNLLIVALWLFAWLTDRKTALSWAILAGLAADLLSFYRFGLITVEFVVVVMLVDYLRSRFFQVSSLLEALLTLLIVSVISLLFEALIARQLPLGNFFVSTIANVVIGAIAYYILAVRFRLFQRWAGQRL